MATGAGSATRAHFHDATFDFTPILAAMENADMGRVIVENEVKDLIGPVTTKAGVQYTGATFVRIRLELDGDSDDGREWDGAAWVVSPAPHPSGSSLGSGRHLYQLQAAATLGKLNGRITFTFTDNITESSATTISPVLELLIDAALDEPEIDSQPILLDSDNVQVGAALKRHGVVVTDATTATLTIRTTADPGVEVFTQTINAAPNVHGVYEFSGTPNPLIIQGTYSVLISITDPLGTVTGRVEILGKP